MEAFFEDILDSISREKCALFVGPGVMKNAQGESISTDMWKELDVENADNAMIKNFFKNDGFFLFREENQRRRFSRRVRSFFENDFEQTDEFFKKLSTLPFPLIINMASNTILNRAFSSQGKAFQYDFYFMGQPFKPFVKPSLSNPLIYGLMGSLEESESLILTHKDLFNYLESIFLGKSMSEDLRKYIQDMETFVFIGLPYEKWYMQLLLRVLYHISAKPNKILQYASSESNSDQDQLYRNEFLIDFIPKSGEDFIHELHKICEEENLLKEEGEGTEVRDFAQDLKQAQGLLAKNKIQKGIDLIKSVLEFHLPLTQDLLNDLIKIQQSFVELNKKEVTGMATETDKANLNQSIFNCITLIPQISTTLGL